MKHNWQKIGRIDRAHPTKDVYRCLDCGQTALDSERNNAPSCHPKEQYLVQDGQRDNRRPVNPGIAGRSGVLFSRRVSLGLPAASVPTRRVITAPRVAGPGAEERTPGGVISGNQRRWLIPRRKSRA